MWGSFPNPPCFCFALPAPSNCSLLPLWKLLLILITLLLGTLQLPSNPAAKSTALDFLKDREPPSHKLALTGTYHSVCHRAHNQVTDELPHPSSWSNSAGKGRFVLLLCGEQHGPGGAGEESSLTQCSRTNRHCWCKDGGLHLILCCPHIRRFMKSSGEQASEILPKCFKNAGSVWKVGR